MVNWKMGVVGAALSLCVAPIASAAEIVIRTAPPVVREEPPPPRAGYVWTGSHYEWRHHRHVLVRGHWVRERRGHEWVPGHWEERDNRYHYHRGRWHPHR